MQASSYRSQLERKNKARADADKKVGEYRRKEADKRAAATKSRAAAARTRSASTAKSKLREASRHDSQADAAAHQVASWSARSAKLGKEVAALQARLAKAEDAERKAAAHRSEAAHRAIDSRLGTTEQQVETVLKELRAPKPEKLRVLMLGAAPAGDLRVNREQAEIRSGVERALHRDLVELDVHPAATTEHLLDGLTKFRPHVVHFSGHSEADLLVFEEDRDELHGGVEVSAEAFAMAIAAPDEPPVLVVLNSCHSAAHIKRLTELVPFAIGMADEIPDKEALKYAACFYAAVANGQSIQAAHEFGRVAIEVAGLPSSDLPTLESAPGFDPRAAFLVKPPQ
ncbi:hypothetical protein ACFV0R_03310 [Streptomyces sp. NPDC059578]|uniref:hypothetical protein n=1 Tax=unclassified Streptomyces TaxID=2593676 RepID=UPI0036658A4C